MSSMSRKNEKRNLKIIRVLCVNLEGNTGGAEQSLLLFVRFVPDTVQITVACPPGVLSERLKQLNIETYKILSAPRSLNLAFIWFCFLVFVNLQLILIVFKTKPQIIHANGSKAVLAVVMTKLLTKQKIAWHARDMRYSTVLVRLCCYFSSRIIAVSSCVKNLLTDLGVKEETIDVIYNGVATDDLPPKGKENPHTDCLTFANIGQFVPWKKQLLFIEAAERYLQEGYDANFVLIGDDIFGRDSKYKKELLVRINASSFASNIQIIDWQDDLNSFWSQIYCLIHTADAEPFGRVIIEAMIHNVSVIAAGNCGPAEIIQDGVTGLLFKSDDIKGLVRAMQRITADKGLAYRLAENARQYVSCNFQARQTSEKITKVYEKLLVA